MRTLAPALAAHLAARKAVRTETLVRIRARNRTTGALETLGLWTGPQTRLITVEGEALTWVGAGGLLEIEPIVLRAGIEVRQHRLRLSPYDPAVMAAIGTYDARLAPVAVFEWPFDPATMAELAPPMRVLKGHLVGAPTRVDADGGEASVEAVVTTAAWVLTRSLALKRSHEALAARAPADGFRRFADVSGSVEVAWGETIATGPSGSAFGIGNTDSRFVVGR